MTSMAAMGCVPRDIRRQSQRKIDHADERHEQMNRNCRDELRERHGVRDWLLTNLQASYTTGSCTSPRVCYPSGTAISTNRFFKDLRSNRISLSQTQFLDTKTSLHRLVVADEDRPEAAP